MHWYHDLFSTLIRSWEFWLCALATIPSVLALLIPDFPASLTIALDVLLLVLLASFLHADGECGSASRGERAAGQLDKNVQE